MRVVVGMSGGVDSSVAAYLLKKEGHEVIGVFMKNWEEEDTEQYCHAAQDLEDAKEVANRLEIPLHTVNFSKAYWEHVFQDFLAGSLEGRTPNPDILCNREIKFKAFLNHALTLGADKIATGHYAAIGMNHTLEIPRDHEKDQTYFLYTLQKAQLERSLFPLASFLKKEVRMLAEKAKLSTALKKDSTGICFIGKRSFRDFLSRYLPMTPGPITTDTGVVLGEHQGLMYYTLGQRQGLFLGGKKGFQEAPWFVLAKDVPENRLVVTQDPEHPWRFSSHCILENVSWVSSVPTQTRTLLAKVRYRQKSVPCTLLNTHTVHFQNPLIDVTPGQSLVLYEGSICLGGGIIATTDTLGGVWKHATKNTENIEL